MNLQSLLAGGIGSGCNPKVGKCGRKKGLQLSDKPMSVKEIKKSLKLKMSAKKLESILEKMVQQRIATKMRTGFDKPVTKYSIRDQAALDKLIDPNYMKDFVDKYDEKA